MTTHRNQAQVFQTGGSQAVRLPAPFRFKAKAVYIRRDDATGDVILSTRAPRLDWRAFLQIRAAADPVKDFLNVRSQSQEYRDPFAAWNEDSDR
jgi:antitoxin VapB